MTDFPGERLTPDNDENPVSYQKQENNENQSINSPPENNENIGQSRHGPNPSKPLLRSPSTPYLEDKLRRELKFFFMGPHEKIVARKKFPWKLTLQIVKVIIVTVQVGVSSFITS